MKYLLYTFYGLVGIIFVLAIAITILGKQSNNTATQTVAEINHQTINLTIANTNAQRTQGLSDIKEMPKKTGMLFLFKKSEIQSFWNQDMRFPLDIVWLKAGQVVGLGYLPIDTGENVTIQSPTTVDQVLEINAGQAKTLGIKKDTKIEFKNIPDAN